MIEFTCNICGSANRAPPEALEREVPSCLHCGSTVRFRGFVAALSEALFGEVMMIEHFPVKPDMLGIGLSDWGGYAERLADKFDFRNTFLTREPHLDILDIPDVLRGRCDFVCSNDVFEHVPPPAVSAFSGAMALLKPGGTLVLSVPFAIHRDHTIEHFPELHAFELRGEGTDARLHNRTRDGREQVFDGLKFHGGEGMTLEMRIFSRTSLAQTLAEAGFVDIHFHERDILEFGIHWPIRKSLPVTARRPAAKG